MSNRKNREGASGATESFLVRLWREPSDSADGVRVSARQLRTGEQRHFAVIEDLNSYLMSKMSAADRDESDAEGASPSAGPAAA